MNLLRRRELAVPEGLPPLARPRSAHKFERMLMQAQVTIPTGAADADHPGRADRDLLRHAAADGRSDGASGSASAGSLISATFAGVLGAALPLMLLNFKATRTRKKMQEQFPVALDVFVRGLRAGHPIAAALDLLTVEMPDPIGTQFGLVGRRSDLWRRASRCAADHGRALGPGRHADVRRLACRCRARPAATSPRSWRICRRSSASVSR